VKVETTGAGVESWHGQWWNNGKQIKRMLGPKTGPDRLTKRQAEKRLRELMAEVKATAKVADVLTIRELGARYMQAQEKRGRKRATRVAVESALRVWLEPFFGERGVNSITPEDVDDLIAEMDSEGLSAKSIRNYIGTLSAMFNYARSRRQPWMSANPCVRVELPGRQESTEIRFLDLDELDALLLAVEPGAYEQLDHALYVTAAMTGMREGELLALRWHDVDWPSGKIRVRQNYVLGEYVSPKGNRTRSVPMADRVAGELDRYFKARHGEQAGDAQANKLVFGDPVDGKPLKTKPLLRRYRKALKAAGLDESRVFHDLRHTFGTQSAAAGVPMRTLQEWMGHKDIKTTEIYAHYAPSTREAALIEAAFSRDDQSHNPVHI